MTKVFPYLVTHLSKEKFERTLSEEIFPEIKILRRNALGTRHVLRELGSRDGRTEYLWLIRAEFTGGSATGPPALSELQAALGPFGFVAEPSPDAPPPFACVTVDFDPPVPGVATIDPNLVNVLLGEPMTWCFFEMPPGYKPYVDFVAFRPNVGDGRITRSFEPPFEELTVGSQIVTGAQAKGPAGTYWYKISLVPERGTGEEEVIRLNCHEDSYHEREAKFEDGSMVAAAGVEVSPRPIEPAG